MGDHRALFHLDPSSKKRFDCCWSNLFGRSRTRLRSGVVRNVVFCPVRCIYLCLAIMTEGTTFCTMTIGEGGWVPLVFHCVVLFFSPNRFVLDVMRGRLGRPRALLGRRVAVPNTTCVMESSIVQIRYEKTNVWLIFCLIDWIAAVIAWFW